MVAGRELDALMADKVMGWKVSSQWWNGDKSTFDCQSSEDGTKVPNYSTSIADAWKVIKRFNSVDISCSEYGICWFVVLERKNLCGECGRTVDGYTKYTGVSQSVPLAICKAALKAVNNG